MSLLTNEQRQEIARKHYQEVMKRNEMKFTDNEIVDAYEFFIEKYDNLRVDNENFDNDYSKMSKFAKKQLKHYEVAKYAIKQLFETLT